MPGLNDSMEESMRETLAEIEESEYDEVVDDEPQEPSSRVRDDRGRFAPKSPAEESEPDIEPEEFEEVAEVEEDDEREGVEKKAVGHAPPEWTAAAKSMWNDVPERIKQEVLKRENDSKAGVARLKDELGEQAAFGQRIQSVVDPYKAVIAAEGSTPEAAVGEMLNSAYLLRTGSAPAKVQMTLQLAQRYGYINELVAMVRGNRQNIPVAPAHDPRIDQLERRIAEQDRLAQERATSTVQQAIESFTSAVDEDGHLVNPYFENVRHLMIPLLESGQHETLESAYEAALWTHPETRDIMLAQAKSSVVGRRQVEAKERATRARKANKVNLPKRGNHESQPNKPTGSIEDTMRETYESLRN